jgi:glycosyltransferase involved in cell wall biosynthesis
VINTLPDKPKVAVIIPTLNEERNLPKLLTSLKRQDYPNYEIVVVDGRSLDQTRKIASDFGCRVIDNPARYAENGKFFGVKNVDAQYVAFIDADNEPAFSGWLSAMVRPLIEQPELAGTFCLYHPSHYSKFEKHYMNLYYSLLGNDPISWYLGGIRHVKTQEYRIFKFSERSYPLDLALANGTIVKRDLLSSFEWNDDIYPLMILSRHGHAFACVYDTYLHHNHLTNYTSFCRKYVTRARFRNIYRRELTSTRITNGKLKLIKWLLYSSFVIWPLYDVRVLYRRWPERVWLIHPLACLTETLIYAVVNRARLG